MKIFLGIILFSVILISSSVASETPEYAYGLTKEKILELESDGYENISKEILKLAKPFIDEERQRLLANNESDIDIEYNLDLFTVDKSADIVEYINGSGSTYSQMESTRYAYAAYDELLNKYYKKFMNSLDSEEEKQALKREQLAWLKYRDAYFEFVESDFEASYGGSLYKVTLPLAKISFLKSRIETLYGYTRKFS